MSWQPIAFMIFTMGGVFALNVLCIVLWLRAPKAGTPAAPASTPECECKCECKPAKPPADAPPASDVKSIAP